MTLADALAAQAPSPQPCWVCRLPTPLRADVERAIASGEGMHRVSRALEAMATGHRIGSYGTFKHHFANGHQRGRT